MDVVVDGDHRRARRRVDAARCDEDDTVRERAADACEVAAFPAGLVGLLSAAGEDDELESCAVDALGDPFEELGAERLDVADEHRRSRWCACSASSARRGSRGSPARRSPSGPVRTWSAATP